MKIETKSTTVGQALSILMTFSPGGYALFLIDEGTGTLSIVSDWGKWQHMWGGGSANWGTKTFVEFLAARDAGHCNYLTDKLHYGRTRMEIDGPATLVTLLAKLTELGGAFERDLRTFAHEIDGKPPNEFWNMWAQVDSELREIFRNEPLYDLIETRCPASMTFLNEQILPAFVAYLQGYLKTCEAVG